MSALHPDRVIENRLAEIADCLDRVDGERSELYQERLALWNTGLAHGLTPVHLAGCSRIKPVTFRTIVARNRQE